MGQRLSDPFTRLACGFPARASRGCGGHASRADAVTGNLQCCGAEARRDGDG